MTQKNPTSPQGEESAPQEESAPKITARGIFTLEGTDGHKGDPEVPLENLIFVPTHLAQGPWFSGALHGGAIVGLAAHAAEITPAATKMRPTRITSELFREVTLDPIRVNVEAVREGRRIQLLRVSLWNENKTKELSRAHVLRIREAPDEVSDDLQPDENLDSDMPVFPGEESEVFTTGLTNIFQADQPAFPAAFNLRSKRDYSSPPSVASIVPAWSDATLRSKRGYSSPRSVSWWKLNYPLVEDIPLTPFVRVATTADFLMSAGGLIGAADYVSINPDLTIYLNKLTDDPWIALASEVRFSHDGVGLTDAALYNRTSRIGNASKSLLIFRRRD